ncbi:hypothetical protein ACFXPN_14820 [Streptomyces griseorubiginosus]|uniref:hypothetical protein n=1 Tax=Streptomyces griseorubiginosus TaxID=67304 RepID=UPI0036CFBC5A
MRVVRHWDDPSAPPSPMAFARLFGSDARRRLEHVSLLNATCLSGVTLLLLGGAWLPPQGSTAKENSLALGVATLGLAVFSAGFLAQLSIGFFGRPRVFLPRPFRDVKPDVPAAPTPVLRVEGDMAEISVRRDEADSYAQLRRYKVYVDGERVGDLRPGETCRRTVSPGTHTVQVKISWCSSPPLSVGVSEGERQELVCRAVPGVESDPVAMFTRRQALLILRRA